MAADSQLDVIRRELEAVGVAHTVEFGGKHPRVVWYVEGRRYACVCAKTSSDYRGVLNCRAVVRRLLRKEGLLPCT